MFSKLFIIKSLKIILSFSFQIRVYIKEITKYCKNSNFSLDFLMSFHFGWKTADQTMQTKHSSLSLSDSLNTQEALQGGIIVEWKKSQQEIPVCLGNRIFWRIQSPKNYNIWKFVDGTLVYPIKVRILILIYSSS